MTITEHKIQFHIPNTIRLLNELRFEQDEYTNKHGWYDRNMIKEVTDEEIIGVINSIMDDGDTLTKEVAYEIIDNIKENTDWHRYRREDGIFDKI